MTQLLEQAINQIRQLPQADQDTIAALILDELADEQRWAAAFAQSQDKLAAIAEKVREEIRAGNVLNGGFDQL